MLTPSSDNFEHDDSANCFAYLGDGFTQLEWDGGDRTADLEERTVRFRNHPALQTTGSRKPKKSFKGEDAVQGVLGGSSAPRVDLAQ